MKYVHTAVLFGARRNPTPRL